MSDLISVFLILFGILQIVLLFKIWTMTDNVSIIAGKLKKDVSSLQQANFYFLKGDIDKAEEKLTDSFILNAIILRKSYSNSDFFDNRMRQLEKQYERYFKMIDRPMPDLKKFRDEGLYF